MIGKIIIYNGVSYESARHVMDEIGKKVELQGTVIDAYTTTSSSKMPNGSTGIHTERVYLVEQHCDKRLVEVSKREVIRLAKPSDTPMPDIQDNSVYIKKG